MRGKNPHTSHAQPQRGLADVLRQSRRELPKTLESTQRIGPGDIPRLVAEGKITREMSCDGKKRYRTFDYADKEIRPILEKRYGKTYVCYACVWCDGFHLATERELAA